MFVNDETPMIIMDTGQSVTEYVAQLIVSVMNDAIGQDREAIEKLVAARVPCNEGLAQHPTIQVGKHKEASGVGLLGILNGIVGVDVDGWGCIAANFDDDGKLSHFELLKKRKIVKRPTGLKCLIRND